MKNGVKKDDWRSDPDIVEREHRRSVRAGIVRSAAIWTPIFAITFAGLLYFGIDRALGDGRATWVLLTILIVLSALFGVQSYQTLSDLRGSTKTVTDRVSRRWTRSDSFIVRSHYIRLNRLILRGDVYVLDQVKAGDTVEVEYYPHTAIIVALQRLPESTAHLAEQEPRPTQGTAGA